MVLIRIKNDSSIWSCERLFEEALQAKDEQARQEKIALVESVIDPYSVNSIALRTILAQWKEEKLNLLKEKWNENVETCSDCSIRWKKIGQACKVCYAPPEKTNPTTK